LFKQPKTNNPQSSLKNLNEKKIGEKEKVNPDTTPGVGNDTPTAGMLANKTKDFI